MGEKIVILGAGIIGLYTGYLLVEQGRGKDLVYIAEYLPGDQSGQYTSPWAGGNFSCISASDPRTLKYDELSFRNLDRIRKRYGDEAGLDRLKSREYWAEVPPPDAKFNSLKSYIPDLRVLPKAELPEKAVFGVEYTTYNFNSPMFIKWLAGYISGHGATFIRRKVSGIDEAFETTASVTGFSPNVLFNCTGLGAQTLGGVQDKNVYPARGQVVVIRAPHINENRCLWAPDYATYVIPRPQTFVDTDIGKSPGEKRATRKGNVGHVVLGGFLQPNNYSTDTYGSETYDILHRTTALYPELLRDPATGRLKKIQELEIVREAAGLRPSRKGGVRIEAQRWGSGRVVIHNYGAGGTGYQSGLGMAMESIRLFRAEEKKLASKSSL